jgi:hypothetical protein
LGYAEAWEFDIDQLALWERSGCLPDSRDAVKDGRRRTVRRGERAHLLCLREKEIHRCRLNTIVSVEALKCGVRFMGTCLNSFSQGIMALDLGAHKLFMQIQDAQRLKDLCPTFDVLFSRDQYNATL